jgi:multicomponent Na+:H+ antiporter subunit G
MNGWEILALALVVPGVAAVWFSCLGMWIMPGPAARLHFVAPAATVGVVCVAAGVVAVEGLNGQGVRAALTALVIVMLSPVVTHATARALRVREVGNWNVLPGEEEEPSP